MFKCNLKFHLIVFISLWVNQIGLLECNTISSERPLVEQLLLVSYEDVESNEGVTCEDQLSEEFCESMVSSQSCPGPLEDSPVKNGCDKSCGLCQDDVDDSKERHPRTRAHINEGCEDKIPNCSSYLSLCCSMKDAMNTSCPKTCKFCSETPATVPPSAPGSPGGLAPGAPTASTGQDPCGSTEPPSVTIDAPAPGQTTTTQASVTAPGSATLPGISLDASVPGQTTTTTQASITGPGNLPGNPVGGHWNSSSINVFLQIVAV